MVLGYSFSYLELSSKNLQIINSGEVVVIRGPSYPTEGDVNWYSHYGE